MKEKIMKQLDSLYLAVPEEYRKLVYKIVEYERELTLRESQPK
jgi:hypothetical protein